jgi:uncharacterized repeat protein (TIGR03803 family)
MKTMPTNSLRNRETALRKISLMLAALSLSIAGASAQTFTTLKSFGILKNVTGFNPSTRLVQGQDGLLYGTTSFGDGDIQGTVFKVQPDGSGFTVLKWFTNYLEGANPWNGLTLSSNVLYGTTAWGGNLDYGTAFKLNTDGSGFTVLKHFRIITRRIHPAASRFRTVFFMAPPPATTKAGRCSK